MQLSFSIDAILGTNKTRENGKCESKNENQDEARRKRERQRASTTKENECTPRSHTIDWKPYGLESTSPRTLTPPRRTESNGKYSADGLKYIMRSPPNASVIPVSKSDSVTKDVSSHQTIRNISPIKMKNFEPPTQIHPGVSQLFPYSMEVLRNRGVNHHPHHYPYQLPFVSHACSLQSKSFPGLFSPNYSVQSTANQTGDAKSEHANSDEPSDIGCRTSPLSSQNAELKVLGATTTIATHSGAVSDTNKRLEVTNLNDGQSSSDSESRIPDQIPAKKKRIGRRLFTGFQILELEKAFAIKPYLNRMERAYISQKVNLTECQIKTWFQNRRTKEKRRGIGSEEDGGKAGGIFSDTILGRHAKPSHIPGYGIQLIPTYGPPDHHLQAAIVNYFSRKKSPESMKSNVDS